MRPPPRADLSHCQLVDVGVGWTALAALTVRPRGLWAALASSGAQRCTALEKLCGRPARVATRYVHASIRAYAWRVVSRPQSLDLTGNDLEVLPSELGWLPLAALRLEGNGRLRIPQGVQAGGVRCGWLGEREGRRGVSCWAAYWSVALTRAAPVVLRGVCRCRAVTSYLQVGLGAGPCVHSASGAPLTLLPWHGGPCPSGVWPGRGGHLAGPSPPKASREGAPLLPTLPFANPHTPLPSFRSSASSTAWWRATWTSSPRPQARARRGRWGEEGGGRGGEGTLCCCKAMCACGRAGRRAPSLTPPPPAPFIYPSSPSPPGPALGPALSRRAAVAAPRRGGRDGRAGRPRLRGAGATAAGGAEEAAGSWGWGRGGLTGWEVRV
jgi:hypothetical protein